MALYAVYPCTSEISLEQVGASVCVIDLGQVRDSYRYGGQSELVSGIQGPVGPVMTLSDTSKGETDIETQVKVLNRNQYGD